MQKYDSLAFEDNLQIDEAVPMTGIYQPPVKEANDLTLAWIKAHVGTEGNEQADQAAKEGAAGGSHMKETQTPIPLQVAKNKIESYTTDKWKQKWICLLYTSPSPRDRQKSRMPSSA